MSTETSQPVRKIRVPRPEERQAIVLDADSRFKALNAGRRWGKSTTSLVAGVAGHGPILLAANHPSPTIQSKLNVGQLRSDALIPKFIGAVHGGDIWWVAPTFKPLNEMWRNLKAALIDAWVTKNEIERRIELPGGGSVTINSTDEYENLRGPGLDGVIVEEAAYHDPRAWSLVLRPMLADRQGWGMFLTTPHKTPNWWDNFWKSIERLPNYARFTGSATDNPRVTLEELEEIKKDPEYDPISFQREYEAKFVTRQGQQYNRDWFGTFEIVEAPLHDPEPESEPVIVPGETNVSADEPINMVPAYKIRKPNILRNDEDASRTDDDLDYPPNTVDSPSPTETVVKIHECWRFAMVDLATSIKTSADFTVIQVWDITPEKDMILVHQFRGRIPGTEHIDKMKAIQEEYNPQFIGIEKVGFQLSTVQNAIAEGLNAKEIIPVGDKISRSAAGVTKAKNGRVFLPKNADFSEVFLSEMISFPNGKNDDQADAFHYAAIESNKIQSQKPITEVDEEVFINANCVNYAMPQFNISVGVGILDLKPIETDSIERLLLSLDPSLVSDGLVLWHGHLTISPSGDFAAFAIGNVSEWISKLSVIQGQPYEVQVPMFNIPLVIKFGPRTDHYRGMYPIVDINIVSDFVVAFRQIRRFNVASIITTNVVASSVSQKFMRAGMVSPGSNVDIATGLPIVANPNQTPLLGRQSVNDFVLAMEEKRLRLPDDPFLRRELPYVTPEGRTTLHDGTSAHACISVIGFLSRFGHLLMMAQEEESEIIELEPYDFT